MLDNTAPMGNRAFPYTTKVVKIVKLFFFSSYIHIHTYVHLYIKSGRILSRLLTVIGNNFQICMLAVLFESFK